MPANGDATSSGVPVELNDNDSSQDTCQTYTYHFTYSGLANYTDSTTTALTAAPNPSSSGQSVTFTATVTETNASIDPSGPTGTVTFYSCTSNTCGSTTSLGTGSVGSNGQATFSTSSLAVGTDYIEAVYGGSGSNLTGSTSNVVTQTVTSGSTLDHVGPLQLTQPVELRQLGHLHRHRLGVFGHAGRHGDLLQLHH